MKLTSRAITNSRGSRTDLAEAQAWGYILRPDGSVMIEASGSGRDWTLTMQENEWRKMLTAILHQRGVTA